jgi:hypothetical protein
MGRMWTIVIDDIFDGCFVVEAVLRIHDNPCL